MQLPSLTCLVMGFILFFCTQPVFTQTSAIANLVQSQFNGNAQPPTTRPFTILHEKNQTALQVAPHAQFLTLDHNILSQINQSRPEKLYLDLPYQSGNLRLQLVRTQITSSDFSVITERGNTPVSYLAGAHYRGIVEGMPYTSAALSFFEDEVMGGINTSEHGNLVLGRLVETSNTTQYILYSDREMNVDSPFSCATNDHDHVIGKMEEPNHNLPEVDKCVRVYLEADNELFLDKGSSVQSTVNYLLGMFNQAATLYANEQINTIVSQLFVWTTPDVYTPTSSATVLNQFKTFRTSFNGDLAHLVGLGGNNLGGIAYVDVLCSTYNYAFSDIASTYSNVPTYSWTVEVFTHEMGHNLGSRHTQWCGWQGGALDNCVSVEGTCNLGPTPINGGTIMSYCHLTGYGINFNNGFGTQPGATIRTETAASSCLSASCPASACDAPIALTITNITGSGATVGWTTTTGATGYALRYRSIGAAQWTTINNPNNPYTLTGLPANDEIEVAVQSLCGSNSSDYKTGVLFITGASGGSGGGGAATCDVPTNFQAIPTATSAQTSWNAVTGAATYSIQWKTSTSSTWSTAVSVSSPSYSITNLSSGTTYNVRVSAACSGSTSAFATTTFTTTSSGGGGGTPCNAPTGLVAAPTQVSAQLNWATVSGATGYSVQWKTTSGTTWNTAVSTTTNNYNITGLVAGTAYEARVSTTCGSTASAYAQVNFTTNSASGCMPSPVLTAVPTQTTAQISWNAISGVTTYTLEWKLASASTWNNSLAVSGTTYTINSLNAGTQYQVRISSMCTSGQSSPNTSQFTTASTSANCGAPTNFVANAGTSSASTTWNAVNGSLYYRIQWKLASSTSWNPLVSTTSPSYTISGLLANTAYHVRVTSLCSSGTSAYTTSTFTTGNNTTACGTPTNLNAVPTSQGANTTWTGVTGANTYSIQWKTTTSSAWSTAVNTSAPTYNITGLAASTAYNVRVAAVCSSGTSAYITTSFTTTAGGSCGAPASISANTAPTSATVSWSTVNGANSYQIQWKPLSSSTWGALTNVSATSLNITGLSENTEYNVRVRSVCNGISSGYTNGLFTTTSSAAATCNVPSNITVTNLQATSAKVTWDAVSGAVSYSIRIRPVGGATWFAFTGFSSNTVTIQNLAATTTYETQVMTNCGNNGASGWSNVVTFTTPSLMTEQTEEITGYVVRLPEETLFKAVVAPNPFTHNAQLLFDTPLTEVEAQISIINMYGQVVSDRAINVMGGTADLDTDLLSAGVYFVKVQIASKTQTVRVIKQ